MSSVKEQVSLTMRANRLLSVYENFKLKDWMIAAVGVLAIKECVVVSTQLDQLVYPAGLIASILFVSIGGYMLGQVYPRLNRSDRMVSLIFAGLVLVALFSNSGPAHAQFLRNAETFFTDGVETFNMGGEGLKRLIFLIFWLIRGAFVIGVAIALLPAIQAAREGEEWRSLAKTPMIVVGIVLAGATSVDFLTLEQAG